MPSLIFKKGLDLKREVAGQLSASYHSDLVADIKARDYRYVAGRLTIHLAREFGCNASSIHARVKAAGGLDGSVATSIDAPLSANERQELIELRRKLKQVQQERDILAKATAWFAGKSEKTSTSSTNS